MGVLALHYRSARVTQRQLRCGPSHHWCSSLQCEEKSDWLIVNLRLPGQTVTAKRAANAALNCDVMGGTAHVSVLFGDGAFTEPTYWSHFRSLKTRQLWSCIPCDSEPPGCTFWQEDVLPRDAFCVLRAAARLARPCLCLQFPGWQRLVRAHLHAGSDLAVFHRASTGPGARPRHQKYMFYVEIEGIQSGRSGKQMLVIFSFRRGE